MLQYSIMRERSVALHTSFLLWVWL